MIGFRGTLGSCVGGVRLGVLPALWGRVFSQNFGEVPEWPKGTDCKSVGSAFGGSNPPLPILNLRLVELAGIAQLARASAFQAEGRGFESRFPLHLFAGLGE
jgi:hypothetical protein